MRRNILHASEWVPPKHWEPKGVSRGNERPGLKNTYPVRSVAGHKRPRSRTLRAENESVRVWRESRSHLVAEPGVRRMAKQQDFNTQAVRARVRPWMFPGRTRYFVLLCNCGEGLWLRRNRDTLMQIACHQLDVARPTNRTHGFAASTAEFLKDARVPNLPSNCKLQETGLQPAIMLCWKVRNMEPRRAADGANSQAATIRAARLRSDPSAPHAGPDTNRTPLRHRPR